MNNKGQVAGYAIAFMLAFCVIVLALAFAPLMNQIVTQTTNSTELSCSNTTNDYNKAACIVTDASQGTFILALLSIAGTLIAARIIFTNNQ